LVRTTQFWGTETSLLDSSIGLVLQAIQNILGVGKENWIVEPGRLKKKNCDRSYENGHGAPFVPTVYYGGFPYTSVTGEIVLSVNAQR